MQQDMFDTFYFPTFRMGYTACSHRNIADQQKIVYNKNKKQADDIVYKRNTFCVAKKYKQIPKACEKAIQGFFKEY